MIVLILNEVIVEGVFTCISSHDFGDADEAVTYISKVNAVVHHDDQRARGATHANIKIILLLISDLQSPLELFVSDRLNQRAFVCTVAGLHLYLHLLVALANGLLLENVVKTLVQSPLGAHHAVI